MPFSTFDNNLNRAAKALTVANIGLLIYAYFLLEAKAKLLTGAAGFWDGSGLALPAMWFGMALTEWRAKQALGFSVVCTAMLLLMITDFWGNGWIVTVVWTLTGLFFAWSATTKKLAN